MRVVIQRVSQASVTVAEKKVGEISKGVLVLLGIQETDSQREADWLAEKVANLRIFEDEHGQMNHSLHEIGGEALVVSQFTLYGDAQKGRRPSYTQAARPEIAKPLYEYFANKLHQLGVHTETGKFQAMMEVSLVNSGPVTIIIDKDFSS